MVFILRDATHPRIRKFRGALHRNHVTGLCHGAKTQMDGFEGPGGDDDVTRRHLAADGQGTPGYLPAESLDARRKIVTSAVQGQLAQNSSRDQIQPAVRKQLRACASRAERNKCRIVGRPNDFFQHRVGSHGGGLALERLGLRLRDQFCKRRANVETRLRPGFQIAPVLQPHVCLQGSREAHTLFPAELSERWHAVPRPQNASGYLASKSFGDPDVERHVTSLAIGHALEHNR